MRDPKNPTNLLVVNAQQSVVGASQQPVFNVMPPDFTIKRRRPMGVDRGAAACAYGQWLCALCCAACTTPSLTNTCTILCRLTSS
eukprot:5131083-Prymnesium_polylepis.1